MRKFPLLNDDELFIRTFMVKKIGVRLDRKKNRIKCRYSLKGKENRQ